MGAGRKPGYSPGREPLSVRQLQDMREAAEKKAEEEGQSLFDVCLDWIYDKDMDIGRRQAAWKMYCDKMLIQVSAGGEADKAVGPAVLLPKQHPRLELVDGGKKK